MNYFTKDEQEVLFEIKKVITDPKVVADKIAHWPVMVKESREVFAGLFESPQPVKEMGIVPEEDTTPYKG